MLEILSAPDPVVAMRASGRLDENDIERGIEAVEAALSRRDRIALCAEIEITGMTAGALARDLSYGLRNLRQIHRMPRVAIVTGQEWVRWIARAEQAFLPGIDVRLFAPSLREAALVWASEPLPPPRAEPEPAGPAAHPIPTTRPDVVAFEVNGRLGRDDMSRLAAAFDRALNDHERLRVLVRVRAFDGVALEALGQEGLAHLRSRGLRRIERYALVGGPAWMAGLTRSVAPLVGTETRHFSLEDEGQAWTWLGAEPAGLADGGGPG